MVQLYDADFVEHSASVSGYIRMFWQDAGFAERFKEEYGIDVPDACMADGQDWGMPFNVEDDGTNIPVRACGCMRVQCMDR